MATLLNKVDNGNTPTLWYKVDYEVVSRALTTAYIKFTITVEYNKQQWTSQRKTALTSTALTGVLKIEGNEYNITIKSGGTSWDVIGTGTGTETVAVNKTITDVQPMATSIQNIEFRVDGTSPFNLYTQYCEDMVIPAGHEKPRISQVLLAENNSKLLNIGIQDVDYVWVFGLSQKTVQWYGGMFDSATLKKAKLVSRFKRLPSQTVPTMTKTYEATTNPYIIDTTQFDYTMGFVTTLENEYTITDSYDAVSDPYVRNYSFLIYIQPTITASYKRVGQTSGKVKISCSGIYCSETIGNKSQSGNYKPTISYKYTYTSGGQSITVNTTIPAENITISPNGEYSKKYQVSDYEIPGTNFNYLNSYTLEITVADYFETRTQTLTVRKGVAVWSEYKDKVKFQKIEVDGEAIIGKLTAKEVDLFNDTSGNTWKDMMKNKLDYCITNYGSNKQNACAFINGGWSGKNYGFGIFSKIGSVSQLQWFAHGEMYYVSKISGVYQYYNGYNAGGMDAGWVQTASGKDALIIKKASASNDGTPNNGIVLEYGGSTSWTGQLFLGDNANQGIYWNGWYNGVRGNWRKFPFQDTIKDLFVVETKEKYTGALASGSNTTLTIDISKSNYKPLGLVGYYCTGTRSSYINVYAQYLDGTNAKVIIKNTHPSTALANNDTKVIVYVLYVSNS